MELQPIVRRGDTEREHLIGDSHGGTPPKASSGTNSSTVVYKKAAIVPHPPGEGGSRSKVPDLSDEASQVEQAALRLNDLLPEVRLAALEVLMRDPAAVGYHATAVALLLDDDSWCVARPSRPVAHSRAALT